MDNLSKLQALCGVGSADLRAAYANLPKARLGIITAGGFGSGVSEMAGGLNNYFNELGLFSRWESVNAHGDFLRLSKKITNALCFFDFRVSAAELERFKDLAAGLDIDTSYDALYLNDHPALLAARFCAAKKIFRCHFDISAANAQVWEFFKPFIEDCDEIIFTSPRFHKPLKGNISYIAPSIDPCSTKNIFVPREQALKVLAEFKIPSDKPIITQVGRFDRAKDPSGVIEVFQKVRARIPCTLVLAGGHADDDPESETVYEELKRQAGGDKDIFLLAINKEDFKIAALQSISDVIVQKSLSESFGLAVTEALWKAKPVVASDIGGIPLQIKNGKTGLLCHNIESCALAVLDLLENKALAMRLGRNGQEFVRENFLITSELKNHLAVFNKIL